MKGTFSRYDPKTGKGTITPNPEPAAQSVSFGAAAGGVLSAKDYTFSIPLAEAKHVKINVGGMVEFDKLTTAGGEATNLRY
ncbi:hypothetical protein [Pseudomonas sp. PB106]|uniref:hypothetical protein n=1 Tax=Pseudomonas sp. PB106 TaxID=2494699 RepID=UPI00131ECB8E|nr:hypothetical protein [Pseudomonas sp. PB106]KAE9641199.1 hypothetical protein EJA71_21405 [Pseudomonas sp. PB106]